jgi:hypothetical protein
VEGKVDKLVVTVYGRKQILCRIGRKKFPSVANNAISPLCDMTFDEYLIRKGVHINRWEDMPANHGVGEPAFIDQVFELNITVVWVVGSAWHMWCLPYGGDDPFIVLLYSNMATTTNGACITIAPVAASVPRFFALQPLVSDWENSAIFCEIMPESQPAIQFKSGDKEFAFQSVVTVEDPLDSDESSEVTTASQFFCGAGGKNRATTTVVAAAQEYFDELEQACCDKKLIILKLVLSPDVHECYRHYGHSLAEERFLPCHPSGHHGDSRLIRGNIAEIQLMYANLAVQDRKFDSVEAALQNMRMRQAENKLNVQKWLAEIGIASKNLRFASFLHVPLGILRDVWPHLVKRFGSTKSAGRALVDRLWSQEDLQACKHCASTCGCHEYGRSRICVHNRQKTQCKDCGGGGICVPHRRRSQCLAAINGRHQFVNFPFHPTFFLRRMWEGMITTLRPNYQESDLPNNRHRSIVEIDYSGYLRQPVVVSWHNLFRSNLF